MIVEEIAKYISNRRIKQKYLAEKTGLSKQSICNMFSGKRKLGLDEYIKICDALQVKYDYFFSSA